MKKYVKFKIGLTEVPPPPAPVPPDDAVARAQYEMETARAEAARLKKMLDEIQKQLPSDEQRARWADLEKQHENAEEVRRRKEGEFDQWRSQITEKHQRELEAERTVAQNARAQADQRERDLNETLVGLAFSQATEWFGDKGKTVLLPQIAQAYFQNHVSVEVKDGAGGKTSRQVVVRDNNGAIIVDTRTGQPLPFEKAIGELIEAHPNRASILRGSTRVGSGTAGEGGDGNKINLNRLNANDFNKQEVRDAVREQYEAQGGIQIAPAYDQFMRNRRR